MKPAAFRYCAPRSIDEAVRLLAEHGDDGKVLAGGQSLVPTMNFRLARPQVLVDINRVAALDYIRNEGGALHIGALTRHARFESPVTGGPLRGFLPQVARHIAHVPIRTRGTFAGSLAHADPASEWCMVAAVLDAELTVASARGTRVLRPPEYFVAALTTALEPDELLTEIRLPLLDARWRAGFAEFSRRAGDYALAMGAVFLRREEGAIVEARLALGAAAECPTRITAAEQALIGSDGSSEAARAAADIAASAIDPLEDLQASGAYRRHLVRAMVERAVAQAAAE